MPNFATLLDSFIKVGRLLWKEEVSSLSKILKDENGD